MSPVWSSSLLRHLAALAMGGLVGWLYDHAVVGLLGGALALLGWHLVNLYRLDTWLRTGHIEAVPDGVGIWPPVFARIEYLRDKVRHERRRWRRLVRELRASAGAFPDGGVLLDEKREIVAHNIAAERLLGLRRLRDRGQRIENLLRHPDFIAYLHGNDHGPGVEVPAPVGGDNWLFCLLIPYGPHQSLLLVRDITEDVRLERTRRDFVANASHELRTPLTVISGYLDAMAGDEDLADLWYEPITDMRAQSQRMSQLLDDLLQLSRLESGARCSHERAVDMAGLLQTARREAMVTPGSPRQVEVEIGSDARVLGDAAEMQSVVTNLVSNAVRYTPAAGTIRICWNVDDEGGHLTVADSGIGIAEEDIPRVTERFYRTDRGRAYHAGGTGLGLAIVKHALRRHDAVLEIRSRIGEGSQFTCHFPPHRLAVSS
ncbi:MAG: phosphate regulon sensor histidine kinase PhoR [Gammaproteobacteria bacterium]|nr:phosphate regulon sensor histidine kinase PhoR [Gammaproteobacteria bacterium]